MYNQMKLMFQLFELLNKRVPSKILIFYLENPSRELYERKIREALKLSRASTIKWLKILYESEILFLKQLGRMKHYRLNSQSPIVKQLKLLLNISKILPQIKSLKGKCKIFLYGSVARGEDTENSDIDLLIIGKQSQEINATVRELERNLKKRIRPSYYTEVEWSKIARKDIAFYERVEKDKIELV